MQNIINDINIRISHKNYYTNNNFYGAPQPMSDQAEPYVCFFKQFKEESTIDYSVVMPIFNQEQIIIKNVSSIVKTTAGLYEIILILDNCYDSTESILIEYFNNLVTDSELVRVIIVKQETPIFETSCDNLGFIISEGKYIVELQADMELKEYSYNTSMSRAVIKYDDVIGISGRCTHSLHDFAKGIGKLSNESAEKLLSELDISVDKNTLYMYGTCNRGPVLFSKEKLKQVGYLDEQNFHQHESEHDLFARAYYLHNLKCGYVPIDYISISTEGSSRINRQYPENITVLNKKEWKRREERSNGGFLFNTAKNKPAAPIETRPL